MAAGQNVGVSVSSMILNGWLRRKMEVVAEPPQVSLLSKVLAIPTACYHVPGEDLSRVATSWLLLIGNWAVTFALK
eukprot:12399793-Karenia_brevis.AAC.1